MQYFQNETPIVLKEYGKIVQDMVKKCVEVPDRDLRNDMAKAIIDYILRINPGIKSTEDYLNKLWNHLYFISDFQLDVDSPYPMVKREYIMPKPEKLNYPDSSIKYKHYGNYIVKFIEHAIKMDEDKKVIVAQNIASYMKLVHKNWNNEIVNDEIVKNDLAIISKGQLEMPQDEQIKQLVAHTSNMKSKSKYVNKNKKRSYKQKYNSNRSSK